VPLRLACGHRGGQGAGEQENGKDRNNQPQRVSHGILLGRGLSGLKQLSYNY